MLLIQDRDLLEAYRRGERAALERVFEEYGPRVVRWLERGFSVPTRSGSRLFAGFRSPADIHDAVHDTFRALFEDRARQAYSGVSPLEGYVFVIMRNVVLKRLRLDARDAPIEDARLTETPSSEPSPEEQFARAEDSARIQSFLTELSEEERGFIELRFTEQRSQLEVAEALGWTRKKVRLREVSLRERLVRFLKRDRTAYESREIVHDVAR